MNPQQNHLRFALACLLLIALSCAGIGGFLLWKGYQSGELYVGIVGTVAGALAGMISMRPNQHTPDQPVEVTTPPDKPLPVTETKP